MKWSILIATLGQRSCKFSSLLERLLPQVESVDGVEVVALWNNGERPLSHVRQDLVENAKGEYISFIDDDDMVPDYYVSEILPLLDGVDQIGWRMQCILNGHYLNPTFHSLKYDHWWNDAHGYYRDISHLNPMRRQLALQVDYRKCQPPEDVSWVSQMRGLVTFEHYIDKIMYYYHANSSDSTWRGINTSGDYERLKVESKVFRYL